MAKLCSFERRWAHDTLAAFAPVEGDRLGLETVPVRYVEALDLMLGAAGPKAGLGLRCALWMAAWAPLWLMGVGGTISELALPQRALTLERLAGHPWRLVRDLTMLLKMAACMALFREAGVRKGSGYDGRPGGPFVAMSLGT